MGKRPEKSAEGCLLIQIFAMGAFDLASSPTDPDGERFYEVARQALSSEMMDRGTLQLVQGIAIMANYLQRSNRPNSGYVCL
jgi:transcriptional regulatory protein GAL4